MFHHNCCSLPLGEQKYTQSVGATKTRISSSLMGHLACMQILHTYNTAMYMYLLCLIHLKLVFIFYFQGIGGVMMGIGFWAVTQKSDYKEFSSISTDPAVVMIVVGLLIFIISFFGTVGALRENICFLRTVSMLFLYILDSRICIACRCTVHSNFINNRICRHKQSHYHD